MQVEELEAALQIINSLSKGGQKFMEICDKIRVTVTPTNTFPGLMEKFGTPTLVTIIQLLQDFTHIIMENSKKYSIHHFSRSIDSSNNAALGCSILFIRTRIPDWFIECEKCIKQSINICKSFAPNELQFSASIIFNIGSYLFAAKEYSPAYRLFKHSKALAIEISTKNIQKMYIKSNKCLALCLIGLDRADTEEFDEAVVQSNCDDSVIYSLICWRPPSNPEIVSHYLQLNQKGKNAEGNCIQSQASLSSQKISDFDAYFALHGYATMISPNSEFATIFPNLKVPTRLHLKSAKLEQKFYMCNTYYTASKFVECNKETIELLKDFPTEKLTPTSYVALLFIYYWIIETFIALDRNNEARWYAKEMRKLFSQYPFTVGFAAFLELKSRIHIAKMTPMKPFPPLQFRASFNWESVRELELAMICLNHNNEQCFLHFQNMMIMRNPIVISESFHYYIIASRSFGVYPNIEEFRSVPLNRASSAIFIYHQIVQILMSEDVDKFWNPQYYVNNKQIKESVNNYGFENDKDMTLIEIKNCQNALLADLKKAEKLATGYPIILRQILQLEALITGTVDTVNTAFLLTTSLSQSLDRYIPSTKQKKFLIPFPILSIAYFNVVGLDSCLLFALYHPNSKPIAIRIKCGDNLDRCLASIENIEAASTRVSPALPPTEWWSQKKSLDDELGHVINAIEQILGPWCGLLAPMIFKPHHSLSVNTLITSLMHNPDLNDAIVQLMEEMQLRTVHRSLISPTKSDSESSLISVDNENDIGTKSKHTFTIDRLMYSCVEKFPLALILGKTVHKIPWESLPIVLNNAIAITRIPSLRLIALHCQENTLPVNVDPKKAFFVLNPQGDLVTTQMTFNEVFVKDFSWDGLAGVAPTGNEILNAIEKYDLFVYCGHGSGKEYFNYSEIIDKRLKCRSSMFLMGCRSCELRDEGDSDPRGIAMCLILGGSGSVVGNLWNVTDRDIDRFLLDLLLRAVENGPFELEKAVLHARGACKLKYLTGAAPIIYGFPTYFNNDENSKMPDNEFLP